MINEINFINNSSNIEKKFNNQIPEKKDCDPSANYAIEDIFAHLVDTIKDEYGEEWQQYLGEIPLPELQPWEIKELQLFLNTPININKEDLDFGFSVSFKELYLRYRKKYNKTGPLYLKGSSLTYFLIHHLTKVCPQGEQSYLERFLRKIISKNQEKSLWEMLSKEEIEALCQKTRPTDFDLCFEEEFSDGQETQFVLNYLAKKVNTTWGSKKISEKLIEKKFIKENTNPTLQNEKKEKPKLSEIKSSNKIISVRRVEKVQKVIKVINPSEIMKNASLFVIKFGLRNFCHVPSYDMHSNFSLISFGDHK